MIPVKVPVLVSVKKIKGPESARRTPHTESHIQSYIPGAYGQTRDWKQSQLSHSSTHIPGISRQIHTQIQHTDSQSTSYIPGVSGETHQTHSAQSSTHIPEAIRKTPHTVSPTSFIPGAPGQTQQTHSAQSSTHIPKVTQRTPHTVPSQLTSHIRGASQLPSKTPPSNFRIISVGK